MRGEFRKPNLREMAGNRKGKTKKAGCYVLKIRHLGRIRWESMKSLPLQRLSLRNLVVHPDDHCVHKRPVILAFLLFALIWAGARVSASEVILQELPLSLYNKPVTGYRFTLDRSQRFVEQQVIKHVEESATTKPFQYDRTLIYENIRYTPIMEVQEMSLYFLMRGYENHYTELTMVAMYDYRRAINSHDFPELSLRVQIDLARLVRKICGDILKAGDIVFDDATISRLLSNGVQSNSNISRSKLGEEEVEHNRLVVPKGGFKESVGHGDGGNPDSTIAALRQRVLILEEREQLLIQNEARLREQQGDASQKQAALQLKIAENRNLKDSITLLNQRVQAMMGQYYVSDDASVSNEAAEHISQLERENKRQGKLIAKLERENDSLGLLVSNTERQAESLSKGRQGMLDEIARLRSDNSGLQVQINQLRDDLEGMQGSKAAESNADSLIQQLKAANRKSAAQVQEMEAVRKEQQRLLDENEQILRSTERLEERISALESENRSLISQQPNPEKPAPALSGVDRDSLVLLRQRMAFLEKQSSNIAAKDKQITDLNNNLRLKDTEAKNLQSKLSEIQGQLNNSQSERKKTELELSNKQSSLKVAQDALAASKSEQERQGKELALLQAQLKQSENGAGKDAALRKSLNDSIFALNRVVRERDAQIIGRDASIRSEIKRNDSLQQQVAIGLNREQELRRQTTVLQTRMDSLAKFAQPETEQQKFIRDQWAKMGDWEKQLEAREKATSDQEKLSNQRTSTLDTRQKELQLREAAIVDLEQREKQVKLREQQLDTRESISGTLVNPDQVKITRITEFGATIPVFEVETDLAFRAAQRQVVAYLLSRDILLSEQFPDLVFRNALLSELSGGQIEMKVRVETNGNNSLLQISFKLPEGNYVGTDATARLNDSARQLIVRMLRYKS